MNAPLPVRREGPQRLIAASFCWMTAAYAFMSASSFAYRQFLAPRVFSWLGTFSDWHAWLYWVWLATAIPVRALRGPRLSRVLALSFVVCGVVVGVALVLDPVLPRLVDDRRSLVVGLLALGPIFWLAAIDFVSL